VNERATTPLKHSSFILNELHSSIIHFFVVPLIPYLTRCREMVSEPDHSSFQSDILKKYLSDLQIFPVMKTLFATLSNLFISNFEKSNHDQS
jgi:hypothetical protein